jgi:hypothetical protein
VVLKACAACFLAAARSMSLNGPDVLDNVAYAKAHNTDQQLELLTAAAGMMADSRCVVCRSGGSVTTPL